MNRKLLQYSYSERLRTQKKLSFSFFYIILLFLIINLFMKYVVFPVRNTSVSMIPDIQNNSFVMCSPLPKKYNRGDVVLIDARKKVQYTKGQMAAEMLVKFFTAQQISLFEKSSFPGTNPHLRRVVALPGDSIYMRDYVLYVKPAGEKYYLTEFEISKKPYNVTFFTAPADWNNSLGVKGSFEEMTLGFNEYFVLGDNRKSSTDSRLFGVVNGSNIKAAALFSYFPFNKLKRF